MKRSGIPSKSEMRGVGDLQVQVQQTGLRRGLRWAGGIVIQVLRIEAHLEAGLSRLRLQICWAGAARRSRGSGGLLRASARAVGTGDLGEHERAAAAISAPRHRPVRVFPRRTRRHRLEAQHATKQNPPLESSRRTLPTRRRLRLPRLLRQPQTLPVKCGPVALRPGDRRSSYFASAWGFIPLPVYETALVPPEDLAEPGYLCMDKRPAKVARSRVAPTDLRARLTPRSRNDPPACFPQ